MLDLNINNYRILHLVYSVFYIYYQSLGKNVFCAGGEKGVGVQKVTEKIMLKLMGDRCLSDMDHLTW